MSEPPGLDGARLAEALAFAAERHAGQTRKGTTVPYLCHLLAVAGLVLEHGGDGELAVAGLLHDLLEDTATPVEELRRRFGERVTRVVLALTDTLPGDAPGRKSPWRERKTRYLEHLRDVDNDALLVCACDKAHNLSALVADLRAQGLSYLERFNAGGPEQVWYHEELLRRVVGRVPLRLQLELESLISQLRSFVSAGDTRSWRRERDGLTRLVEGE